MNKEKKILLVADYGKNDLAFKEVQQKLYDLARAADLPIHIDIVSVDPFHTAQTAAVVAKAASSGQYDMIYHNTAPRKEKDKRHARNNNDGEGLAYSEVQAGGKTVQVVGVNSGDEDTVNSFALLHSAVHAINSAKEGSQFRSRDVFPPHVIAALKGELSYKSESLHVPQHDAEEIAPVVEEANRFADAALKDAGENQLARHGDTTQGYVTIISDAPNAQKNLDQAKGNSNAEVDLIPLKSKRGWDIEAGFVAAQLALNSAHPEQRTLVALVENKTLEEANKLFEAELDNGAHILTDSLKALKFVKARIKGKVSMFGSNCRLAYMKGRLSLAGTAEMVSQAELNAAAALPDFVTPAYTDGYGNVKLAIPHEELCSRLSVSNTPGDRTTAGVSVAGYDVDATIANGSFAVAHGDMALSKGSSGWAETAPKDAEKRAFAEVFLRGGNAAERLGYPQPGDAIRVSRKRVAQEAPGLDTQGLAEVKQPETKRDRAV